jgi:hypothetical protein
MHCSSSLGGRAGHAEVLECVHKTNQSVVVSVVCVGGARGRLVLANEAYGAQSGAPVGGFRQSC